MAGRTIRSGLQQYENARAHPRYNRSGGATLAWGSYFVDTPQGDADSTTIEKGLQNAIAVTTALIAKQPRLIISDGTQQSQPADNAQGMFVEGDCVDTFALVEGTTDIAKGDKLKPVNGQAYLVKANIGAAI